MTARHLRPLAKIADAGSVQSRRILHFIRHSNAVVAYLESENESLALELNPYRIGVRMLCGVVGQFLYAAKHMRGNSLRVLKCGKTS